VRGGGGGSRQGFCGVKNVLLVFVSGCLIDRGFFFLWKKGGGGGGGGGVYL